MEQKIVKNPGKKKPYIKKYRKTIVEAMDPKFVEIFGFDKSYQVFERSINRMEKEGDVAEQMALEYLQAKNILSENYRTNQVITLKNIKMEADIIDYDNKIVYETKSRKLRDAAKKACKEKWVLFEYDKLNTRYSDFKFKGIIVENQEAGPKLIGISDFRNSKVNRDKTKLKMDKYYVRLNELKKIKRNPQKAREHFKKLKKK